MADKKSIKTLMREKRNELMKDQRASAAYWNGDSWGSASGVEAAHAWLMKELRAYRERLTSSWARNQAAKQRKEESETPVCEECDLKMHRCVVSHDPEQEGWSCDGCGWSIDDEDETVIPRKGKNMAKRSAVTEVKDTASRVASAHHSEFFCGNISQKPGQNMGKVKDPTKALAARIRTALRQERFRERMNCHKALCAMGHATMAGSLLRRLRNTDELNKQREDRARKVAAKVKP